MNKRFTEIVSTQKVIDNQTGKEYDCLIDDGLLELLNELHEENRALQRHLDVMRSGALTDDKRIKELYDENQRLKKDVSYWVLNAETKLKEIDRLKQENKELKNLLTQEIFYGTNIKKR